MSVVVMESAMHVIVLKNEYIKSIVLAVIYVNKQVSETD